LCSRAGSPIFSRQTLLSLSRSKVETLLANFPQLIKPGQQHTYVETDNARFIYHPLDVFYIVLITNKRSNILQDMDSLQLLVKAVGDQCNNCFDEITVNEHIFDIIVAFDEVISFGNRENISINSLKTFLLMESHEEMVQEIIARVSHSNYD